MKKAALLSILSVVVKLAAVVTAEAQQPAKAPRIGFLITSSPSTIASRMDAFRQGLRELGYVEGKNIVIERRHADSFRSSNCFPLISGERAFLGSAEWLSSGLQPDRGPHKL
jgi:hypothetical protein